MLIGLLIFLATRCIELPEDMLLQEAQNIGETLQNKSEAMPEVEQAYVHLHLNVVTNQNIEDTSL